MEDLPLRYIHTPTGRDITLSTAHAQSFADASSGSTVLYVMRAEFPDIMKKACTDALLDRLGNPALQTGALMACLGLPVASIHPMLSQFDIGEDTEICSRLQQLQSLREAVEARQKEESKAAATKPKKKGTSKAKEDRGKADAAPGPKANGVAASDGKAARKEQVVKKVAAPTGPAAGPVAANGKKWGTHEVTEPQGRQVTHHEEGPRGPVDPGRQKEYGMSVWTERPLNPACSFALQFLTSDLVESAHSPCLPPPHPHPHHPHNLQAEAHRLAGQGLGMARAEMCPFPDVLDGSAQLFSPGHLFTAISRELDCAYPKLATSRAVPAGAATG